MAEPIPRIHHLQLSVKNMENLRNQDPQEALHAAISEAGSEEDEVLDVDGPPQPQLPEEENGDGDGLGRKQVRSTDVIIMKMAAQGRKEQVDVMERGNCCIMVAWSFCCTHANAAAAS